MYRLAEPDAALSPYIENYWAVYVEPDENVDITVNVYADARADLVFNFGAPYLRTRIGSIPVEYRESNLDAQRDFPISIVQRGAVAIAGVRFRTGGLSPFVGKILADFSNMTVPIAEVLGSAGVLLERDLANCGSDTEGQKRIFDAFFLSRMDVRDAYLNFLSLKREIEEGEGIVSVEDLSKAHAISIRHIDRLFNRHLGFSPKAFAQVVRFQKAMKLLMRDASITLSEVSAACGYFDQPHFIKDFRRFTGGVPRGYKGYYPPQGPSDFAPNVVHFLQDGETLEP